MKKLKAFRDDCGEQYGIISLGIFGSVARDQIQADSDVDVVLKTQTPDPYNIVHIKEELEKLLKLRVDIVRLRDTMNPMLAQRINQESIYV
jgi:predicted nucleotidyltransferase